MAQPERRHIRGGSQGEGDLGLFGLSSPSTPRVAELDQSGSGKKGSAPTRRATGSTAGSGSPRSRSAQSPLMHVGATLDMGSETSLISVYHSADENDSLTDSPQASSSSVADRSRKSPGMHSQLPKLASLPPPEVRPAAGTSGGPAAPPRTSSTAAATHARTGSSNGTGNGEGAKFNAPSPVLSTRTLMNSPLAPGSPRNKSDHSILVPVPDRNASLPNTPSLGQTMSDSSTAAAGTSATTASTSATPLALSGLAISGAQLSSSTAEHGVNPLTPAPPIADSVSKGKAPAKGAEPIKRSDTVKAAKPPPPAAAAAAAATLTAAGLDREALQRWVLSVGCVNFDLELGPDLEFLYPPLGISREERDNIAFSSFPDTSIFDDGSLVFSWRVREVPLDSSGSEPPTIASSSKDSEVADATSRTAPASSPSLGNTVGDRTPTQTVPASLRGIFPEANNTSTSPSPQRRGENMGPPSRPASNADLRGGFSRSREGSSGLKMNHQLSVRSSGAQSRSTSTNSSRSSSLSREREQKHGRQDSAASVTSNMSGEDGAGGEPGSSGVSPIEKDASQTLPIAPPSASPSGGPAASTTRKGGSTSSNYIYGYVFFRQKRDPTIRRGYFQKSVVVLSHLPYVSLFSAVVAKLGPLYFEYGMPMLEAFCNDAIHWPRPEPGAQLSLPLLGSVLSVALPYGRQAQTSPAAEVNLPTISPSFGRPNSLLVRRRSRQSKSEEEKVLDENHTILASIPPTLLFDTFREALPDFWLLWECVLLAEPILVIGPDPKACSEAVWHMLDIIRPIPYAGDFRPYFHIHDYDFKTLVTKNKPQAGTLLGATNPFFAQVCSHWPHVLRVGKAAVKIGSASKYGAAHASKRGSGGVAGGNSAGGGGPDHLPGFVSKRKRRVSKDRPLLRRLLEMAERGNKDQDEVANVMLRRYFADLTEKFLAPLNRYFSSLIPADFDLSSPSETPKIRPFNTTHFLASLKAHGTPLSLRSRSLPTGAAVMRSLYLDFLQCPNFSLWLHDRVAAAEEEQRTRRIAALCGGDVTTFGRTRGEIETIDLYSRLVEEIRLADSYPRSLVPPEPSAGSRWRTDTPEHQANKPPSSSTFTSTSAPTPTLLAAGAKLGAGAVAGTGTSTGGGAADPSFSSGEGSRAAAAAAAQKARLTEQAERLIQTLPEDLRASLRLKA